MLALGSWAGSGGKGGHPSLALSGSELLISIEPSLSLSPLSLCLSFSPDT